MDEKREPWRRVGFFFLLTGAVSVIFWYFIIQTGRLGAGRGLYVTGLMWSPGVAGLVTRYRCEKTLKNHGWAWGTPRLQLLSYFIPIAIFVPLTIDTGKTRFVTGEFGLGLAVAVVIVAFLCWRRRGQLPGGGEPQRKQVAGFSSRLPPV